MPMPSPFALHKDGLLLRLKVTPKAAKNTIGDIFVDNNQITMLKVYVTTVPENGKANQAVQKLLAKALKLPKSGLQLVAGHTDKHKTFLIIGTAADLLTHISQTSSIPVDIET
jgi:uncharacterized protein (TIGR00251 family)